MVTRTVSGLWHTRAVSRAMKIPMHIEPQKLETKSRIAASSDLNVNVVPRKLVIVLRASKTQHFDV